MQRVRNLSKTPTVRRPAPAADTIATPVHAAIEGLQRSVGNNHLAGESRSATVQTAVVQAIVQRAQNRRDSALRTGASPRPAGDLFFRKQGEPSANARLQRPWVRRNGDTNAVIQRLAYNDAPYPDLTPTPTMTMVKSGTGQDGVYLVNDPTGRVVVKFMDQEGAYRTQVANKFMQTGTALATPNSRVIASGQPGNAQIKAAVLQHSQLDLPVTAPPLLRAVNPRLKADAPNDTADAGTAVVVMENVPQTSLREMARTPTEYNRLVTVLLTPAVVEGFAKIIIADAILGNSDRFMKDMMPGNPIVDVPANVSNIFVSPDYQRAVALDNDTDRAQTFTDAQKANLGQSLHARTYLSRALTNPTIATQLAEAVVSACLMDAGELAVGQVVPNLSDHGVGALSTLMHNYNVRNGFALLLGAALQRQAAEVTATMRAHKDTLRASHAEAGAQAGYTPAQARAQIDYNQLRARAKYVEILAKGKNDANALNKARAQLVHKEDKDAGELPRQKVGNKIAGLFGK